MACAGLAAWMHPMPWVIYICGATHTGALFATVGQWVAAERDRRFTKWLKESTDAASADISFVNN